MSNNKTQKTDAERLTELQARLDAFEQKASFISNRNKLSTKKRKVADKFYAVFFENNATAEDMEKLTMTLEAVTL